MKVLRCSRCGGYIQSDELRYLIGMHVVLDRDGFSDQDRLDAPGRVAATCRDGESMAERFVCEKAFTVCTPCRDQIVDNPLGRAPEAMLPDHGFVQ